MRGLVLVVSVVALSCSGPRSEPRTPEPPPPPPEEPDAGPPPPAEPVVYEDTAAPDGPPCTRSAECGEHGACRGPAGCTTEWACGDALSCEPATIAYCDCDGQTFYAQSGCAGRPYLHVGPCAIAAEEVELGIPDGDEPLTDEDRTCTSSEDCRRWETCFGRAGCGVFRCERVRRCRRDSVAYCGCDGVTFRASSNCPGRPYLHTGACTGEAVAVTETPAVPPEDGGELAIATAPPTPPPEPAITPPVTPAVEVLPEGACRTGRDCRGMRICAGPPGCGFTWTCEPPPAERCNPDTQVFCDCEGETFRASMNCPERPYAHRGSCEIDRLLDLAGGAMR